MRERVLITGVGGPAGRSASVYFRGRGYPVIGTDMRKVEDVEVEVFRTVPPARDPSYPAALLGLIGELTPGLFIPTVTEELGVVAGLKGEIEGAGCRVFISAPGAVEVANDKFRTAVFMEERGVAVPRTFEGALPAERVLAELGLPLLAKPVFSRGGRGVVVYRTPEEVRAEQRQDVMFQEFVPGPEFDVNLFISGAGRVLAAVALEKTALKEGITGNAVGVRRVHREDAVELAQRACRSLGLTGPQDVDIRLREDGTPVLLEINARLGGNVLHAQEILDSLLSSWKKEEGFDACN
ncbi:MAG: ATP-grasp domain-containing protein [Thermodesulfobacteriota bacterium]